MEKQLTVKIELLIIRNDPRKLYTPFHDQVLNYQNLSLFFIHVHNLLSRRRRVQSFLFQMKNVTVKLTSENRDRL